uniref:Uncharacterized protein n=1 Tax=Labrus bergylta TaxID=56723 RepID=A0A3Q3G694_9LABR
MTIFIIIYFVQSWVEVINSSKHKTKCTYFIPQNTDSEVSASIEQTVLEVYVIQKEGAEPGDDPEDISILIEGVKILNELGNIGIACALLFGLIYCLNLSYPPDLKCTLEVMQKIPLNLDGQRLSSKAQFLKNKLME